MNLQYTTFIHSTPQSNMASCTVEMFNLNYIYPHLQFIGTHLTYNT